jgi:hypothetical protein
MLALETRAWKGWWLVRFPTTESIGGDKTSPVVLRRLSHTGSVDVCRRRHIERTRETGRIGWSVELVAQIQERLVVGGLGTEAFVCGIRG